MPALFRRHHVWLPTLWGALVVLVALAFFFRDWTAYVSLLSVALFFVRGESGFESPYLVLTIISGAVFLLKDYFPWSHQFLNTAVGIGFGTVFVYVFADIRFLANDPFTVFIEVIYNVLVGVLVYSALKRLISYETQFRTSH